MRFGDLSAVKAALFKIVKRAEVVDEDLAVDFRCVKLGAGFPEERSFSAGAFGEEGELAANPVFLARREMDCWSFIRRRRRDSMVRCGTWASSAYAAEPSSCE